MRKRLGGIGGVIDIDVAVAVEVLDHRHLGVFRDALDQALAAARHDDVDVLGHGDEMAHRFAVGGLDHLYGGLRQAGGGQALAHAGGDRLVGAQGFLAAAQDRGVAGLEAQRGGIGRDVGPRFVDDADHAQRHAHAADLDAGGAALHVADFADRVGQGGDLLQALCHGFDALVGQLKAVDHRRVQSVGARFGDIGGIRGEQFGAARTDRRGHRQQGRVLGSCRGARSGARSFACGPADLLHVVFYVHKNLSATEFTEDTEKSERGSTSALSVSSVAKCFCFSSDARPVAGTRPRCHLARDP
jgi:hypothetical protein